ncbi:MAG: GNAT family N-acetyltransferase [Kiloniellales bacterium]|nr:GNAT family N-acetyltransferase [Kiloniellales bacterium]
MVLLFRSAAQSEREAVKRVLRSAFTAYVRRLGRELSDSYDWLEAAILDGRVHAGVEDGRIVGAVVTERGDDGLYIRLIAVDPERQGNGIGSRLLERVEEAARAEGLAALSLHTAEIMDDLLRLYRRHGFREVGREPPDHGKDAILRVRLQKKL